MEEGEQGEGGGGRGRRRESRASEHVIRGQHLVDQRPRHPSRLITEAARSHNHELCRGRLRYFCQHS